MEEDNKKKDYSLPASILIAGVMISGSIIYLVGSKGSSPTGGSAQIGDQVGEGVINKDGLALNDRDVILGGLKAPVTFIEYGDYQCPFCARLFAETEPRLREDYVKTGKVKMVYRNFAFLGPESFEAAEAAECAKDQKQFWAFHDALYTVELQDGKEHNGNLNRDLFVKIASDLKLDAKSFTSCFDGKKYADLVQKSSADARTVGVNSTPTVYVNDRQVTGALPYDSFKAVIDSALN